MANAQSRMHVKKEGGNIKLEQQFDLFKLMRDQPTL